MIRRLATALLLALAAPAQAQMPEFVFKPFEKPAQPGEIVLPSVPASTPDREQWMLQGELVNVRNVTRPTLVPVLPAGKSTGAAMIVAPGGGFLGLAIDHEGWQIARWLANHGIAAFVLKYRVLPTPRDNDEFMRALHGAMQGKPTGVAPPADTPPEALADGLAAIRHVREHAKEFGVDPHRVGFMGFSAGGFLSRSVVSKGGKDAPDFVAPIYPNMASLDVPANAPPMFVAIAADDFLLAREKGLPLVDSYRAAGAPIEFHLLANGGHGFGLEHGTKGKASEDWIELLHRWMGAIGVLDAKSE